MSNQNQQLIRLALRLFRLAGRKLSLGAAIGLCLAAVLYVLVLQPIAEKRFGVSLPSILTADRPADGPAERPAGKPSSRPSADRDVDPGSVLASRGKGVYESPAGIRYTRGSQHGHRFTHVMAHARDEPNRRGQHGVFDDDNPAAVVALVDEAYELALAGERTRAERDGQRMVYTVDMNRRVGYVGGESGARKGNPAARHIKLVMIEDRLITAFPLRR
ncbi:MAG: hypothetical protein AAFV43_01185 [Planctomycetota bacterium]